MASLPAWFIVHTRANAERLTEDSLRRKGFDTFLPMETKRVRHARQLQVVSRPLFKRYLFVGLNPARLEFAEVRKTWGVDWLVSNVSTPVRVPIEVIDNLRNAEGLGVFDRTGTRLQAGQEVAIAAGPFSGLAAEIITVSSDRRIEVLLRGIGTNARVTVGLANLKLVG